MIGTGNDYGMILIIGLLITLMSFPFPYHYLPISKYHFSTDQNHSPIILLPITLISFP